jgi:ribosome-associated toxin RatA of RatAB toxin-antitoxin module
MEAELTVGFQLMEERYTSKVTCIPNESVEVCTARLTGIFVR